MKINTQSVLFPACVQLRSDPILGISTSGYYVYQEMVNDKPAYKHEAAELYLFYAGWWKVDTSELFHTGDKAAAVAFIRSELDVTVPEFSGYWKYYGQNIAHTTISVSQGESFLGTGYIMVRILHILPYLYHKVRVFWVLEI